MNIDFKTSQAQEQGQWGVEELGGGVHVGYIDPVVKKNMKSTVAGFEH